MGTILFIMFIVGVVWLRTMVAAGRSQRDVDYSKDYMNNPVVNNMNRRDRNL